MRTDLTSVDDLHDLCKSDDEMNAAADGVEKTAVLEDGKTYKVRIGRGCESKWHTVVRRKFDSGEPSLYYVEDNFEDYYYEDEPFLAEDVREIG